jgi:MFS family permease
VTSPAFSVVRHRHARTRGHSRRHAVATPPREIAASAAACLALAAVIPLALSQLPNGLAWSLTDLRLSSPGSQIAVLRACGLALPAMLATVPYAAFAVRKAGAAWPLLLAGLIIIALADLATGVRALNPGGAVAFIATDRILHGAGGGLALPAAATLLADGTGITGTSIRRGVVWTMAVAAGLTGAPLLVRAQVSAAPRQWLTALRPAPWLTACALAAVAVWMLLAGQTRWRRGPRRDDTQERDRLALVAAPLAALALMMVAVSFRSIGAVVGTAIAGAFVLTVLTDLLARDSCRAFVFVCALAGFTLMPGASVLTGLRLLPPAAGLAVIAAAAVGFAAALAFTLRAAAADLNAAIINGTVLLIGAAGAGYLAVGAMMVHG